jgi:hypothetical protein
LVENGFDRAAFKKEFERQGMITLYQDLALKAAEGLTTVEEVKRLAQDTSEVEDVDDIPTVQTAPKPGVPNTENRKCW